MIKRILFIGSYPNAIDTTRNCFYQNLIHAIAETGIECTVISPISITHYRKATFSIPEKCIETTKNGKKIVIYYTKYMSFSAKKFGLIKTGILTEKSFQLAIKKAITKYSLQFDCVYGHFFLGGGLAAVAVGKKFNVPSFIAFGEDSFEECVELPFRQLNKKDMQGLSGVICVSSNNKNVLNRRNIFESVPMLVAPNCVSEDICFMNNKVECRKMFGIPKDIFVIGYVGAFDDRKGDLRLCSAIKDLNNVYVAFAGQGREHVGDNIVFSKKVSRRDIPFFLNAVDIFALPTLSEGCCNAIVEALACGLPVVSSDLPFNDDILNTSNSIRVDPRNIKEIRNAVLTLKQNPDLVKSLSEGALKTAKTLTIKSRAKAILDFMESYA